MGDVAGPEILDQLPDVQVNANSYGLDRSAQVCSMSALSVSKLELFEPWGVGGFGMVQRPLDVHVMRVRPFVLPASFHSRHSMTRPGDRCESKERRSGQKRLRR